MEYIQGLDIDDYCKQKVPNLKQRIDLIKQVCAAVSFSHQQLILHRDLKPSNILVTESGLVKLLDFGIAKLTDLEEESQADKTATQIMTRNYASPEQIQGKAVSTHSDLFSLAIIAYELITGFHPFKHKDQIEREHNLITGKVMRVTQRSDNESLYPELSKIPNNKIQGDLENILLKALSVEPEKRYTSVQEFSDDLNNFITHQPVKARKPNKIYYLYKWVQRHIGVTVLTLVTLLTLSLATLYSMDKADFAQRQQQIAEQQKNKAIKESQKSKLIADFLKDLFLKSKPDASSKALTAYDLLNQGIEKLNTQSTLNPEHKFELLTIIYDSFFALGKYKAINDSIEVNYNQCSQLLDEKNNTCQLILIALARSKMLNNDYPRANELFAKAEAIAESSPPIQQLTLAEINTFQFAALLRTNENSSAISKAQKALSFYKKHADKYATRIHDGLNNIAIAHIFANQHQQANIIIEQLHDNLQIINTSERASFESRYFNLKGFYYETLHQPRLAASHRGKAIENIRTNYEVTPVELPWYLYKQAKNLARAGNTLEAIKIFEESRKLYQEKGSGVETYLIKTTIQLALMKLRNNEFENTEKELLHLQTIGLEHLSSYYSDKCDLQFINASVSLIKNPPDIAKNSIDKYQQECQDYFAESGPDSGDLYQAYWHYLEARLSILQKNLSEAKNAITESEKLWVKYPQDYLDFKMEIEQLKKSIH